VERKARHEEKGKAQQQEVQFYLSVGTQPVNEKVTVGVAQEQQELEKEQTSCPDRGAAPIPWQDVFGDNQLNLKE